MDWLFELKPHLFWFALGFLLAAGEILVPGTFLIWMAGAAIITGLLTWVLPIGMVVQIIIFASLAIVAVFAGRRYLKNNPIEEADPLMNKRGARLVGETATVVQVISNGKGRVHLGDSEWNVRGPDADIGATVRVTGSEGATLLVELVD